VTYIASSPLPRLLLPMLVKAKANVVGLLEESIVLKNTKYWEILRKTTATWCCLKQKVNNILCQNIAGYGTSLVNMSR